MVCARQSSDIQSTKVVNWRQRIYSAGPRRHLFSTCLLRCAECMCNEMLDGSAWCTGKSRLHSLNSSLTRKVHASAMKPLFVDRTRLVSEELKLTNKDKSEA